MAQLDLGTLHRRHLNHLGELMEALRAAEAEAVRLAVSLEMPAQ